MYSERNLIDIPYQGISRPGQEGLSVAEIRHFLNIREIEDLVKQGNIPGEGWNPSGYPHEYIEGFKVSDESAVLNLLRQFSPNDNITGVTIETDKKGTLVQINRPGSLTQVNWANPEKTPCDYQNEGYARTFWKFYGPKNIQSRRADLVAQNLGVRLFVGCNEDMISVPSLGIKIARPSNGWFAKNR